MRFVKASFGFFKEQLGRLDKLLLLFCVTASVFSAFLLYTMVKIGINSDIISSRTWKMQLAACVAGSVAAFVISLIDYKIISKIWLFTYAPAALILSLLLFTPLGMNTDGSNEINWLNLGFMQIQPSEFLTVAFIMTFATHLNKIGEKINHLPNLLLLCGHALIPILIMVLQKNTGAPVLVGLIFILMLFMGGISWKYIAAVFAAIPIFAYGFWNFYANDYHKMRILVIFDKEIQQQEILGYFNQQYRGLTAMGSGGITGLGFASDGYTSMFAIHNDFIFAYIGMTLGLIGCILTLLLLLAICIKLLTVMGGAKDSLGKSVCAGVFAMFFFHTIINVGMVTAVSPVVGVPLPLISSGGSSTLSLYIAVGLVLSVHAQQDKKYRMFD
ncbi:MAG: FtsW/RodA/SpoVE family cell cycle protein [Oscillospiraceae bacterium]|nr:FtsW/RodA/SpoVE family cell cycle protein [Oscillospiraceae bacterium]